MNSQAPRDDRAGRGPVRQPEKLANRLAGALSGPRQTRDTWRGLGDAWTAVSYILSGIAVWGGAGWLLDRWLSTGPVLLVIGILVGNFAGVYLVYIRTFPKEASRAS